MSQQFPALELEGYSGRRLGRFEVMCKLGAGGMSEVFLAWQTAVGGFKRPVVVKRILESVKRNEEFLRMFVKEAKITAALSHGGIAHLYELVHEDDELFMVMEFVPGATLVEVARACHVAHEPIPIGFSLSVLRDTATALQYAHTFVDPAGRSRPIIHRDIAEKNIMVGLDGAMKLLDFGIARQLDVEGRTQVGTVKGTAGYMSPEQVRGEKLDARSDLFSLGVVLHECLTGQRLFRRNTLPEEVQALLEAPIQPPSYKNKDITGPVDAVVMKSLQRDRTQRYSSAKEMGDAIAASGGDLMWDQARRAEFIQRHFERRQKDILSLLGDPSSTDVGDLLPETNRRVTRDEARKITDKRTPLADLREEATMEVRSVDAPRPGVPAVVTSPLRSADSGRRVIRRGPTAELPRSTPVDDADMKTVVPGNRPALPRPEDPYPDDDGRTVTSAPGMVEAAQKGRRTEPSLEELRPALDADQHPTGSVPGLDEPGTVVETEDQKVTDEASERRELSPQRVRLRNLAAQKQAMLMWIAIGSGLLLGVALAAFLIFG